MIKVNRTIRSGQAQMDRNLREEVVIDTDLIARTAFEIPVFEFAILDLRQETERSKSTHMPAGNIFDASTKAHAHARFTHERHAGTKSQFKNETVLEPVTTAFRVCIFVQTLFFFKLFTGKEILFLSGIHASHGRFGIFFLVIIINSF